MNILWKPVGNHNARPADTEINALVIHATAGVPGKYGDSDAIVGACLNWWNNPASEASAHYLIKKDGSILQCVAESRRAWHAGISLYKGRNDWNDFAIGIELANENDGKDPYPPAQIDSLVWLCQNIRSRHPIQRQWVVGHVDISGFRGKSDPKGLDLEPIRKRLFYVAPPPPPPPVIDLDLTAEKARWWAEEAKRAMEAGDHERADKIMAEEVLPRLNVLDIEL